MLQRVRPTVESQGNGDELVDGVLRKRRRGEAKGFRFSMNVRAMWAELDGLGGRHAMFSMEGVIDLVVEYGQPVLPLFARLPPAVGGAVNIGARISSPGQRGSARWRQLYDPRQNREMIQLLQKDVVEQQVPLGSTISCACPPALAPVDAVVVVHPDLTTSLKLQKGPELELWVGVVIPTIVKQQPNLEFGADRTIFMEMLDPDHDASAKDWDPRQPPSDGYYAVHYINVWQPPAGYYNPTTKRYSFRPVATSNDPYTSVPNSSGTHSHSLLHRLHGEIDHDLIEQSLLKLLRQRIDTSPSS